MPLVPVLAEMEMAGVALDLPYLAEAFAAACVRPHPGLEEEIHQAVGYPFNINSTQQLADVLFAGLGLTPARPRPQDEQRSLLDGCRTCWRCCATSTRWSTWSSQHRELSKLRLTYVDALPAAVDPRTGRVHTSYNQTGAVTGRLSSSNPNLQNIPIRTEDGPAHPPGLHRRAGPCAAVASTTRRSSCASWRTWRKTRP